LEADFSETNCQFLPETGLSIIMHCYNFSTSEWLHYLICVCVFRVFWAQYFDSIRTKVAFFSAIEETKRLKDEVFSQYYHTVLLPSVLLPSVL